MINFFLSAWVEYCEAKFPFFEKRPEVHHEPGPDFWSYCNSCGPLILTLITFYPISDTKNAFLSHREVGKSFEGVQHFFDTFLGNDIHHILAKK